MCEVQQEREVFLQNFKVPVVHLPFTSMSDVNTNNPLARTQHSLVLLTRVSYSSALRIYY
jgi:hypothetical protein